MMALKTEAQPVQTPLLGRLFADVDEEQRLVVLDLGVAMPSFLAAFGPTRLRWDTLNLCEHQRVWMTLEDEEAKHDALFQHLSRFDLEPLDWICGWSYLNYLDPNLLSLLAQLLAPYLKPKTRWHALIEYSQPTMPSQAPEIFVDRLGDQVYLSVDGSSSHTPAPRYTPKRLENILNGLTAESTMLLANGWQEYLFKPIPPTES
jgi:hypothetical protein